MFKLLQTKLVWSAMLSTIEAFNFVTNDMVHAGYITGICEASQKFLFYEYHKFDMTPKFLATKF